ncbi:MAG: Flavodoxin [Firmicutes bacterium]|nr:Flavodoxin [Bacillota bacterium]
MFSEIKTVKQYPTNYRECTAVAKQELATKVNNVQDYDVIFLGYADMVE